MIFRTLLLSASLIPFQFTLADIDRGKEAYYMGEYERAIAEFTPDAENGDTYALVKLGFMAENGWGTSKDYQKAHGFYKRAADLDSAEGYISLAKLYAYAKGVNKNEQTAKNYLLKAVSFGENHAYYILGNFYNDLFAFGEQADEALKWYLMAAENNAAAYSRNGHYTMGSGHWFRLNTPEGVMVTRNAADNGNIYAQFNTGLRYHYGEGVPKDYDIAEEYFLKAANAGHIESQRFVGQNHAVKNMQNTNNVFIDTWFTIAAIGGNKEAMRNKAKIELSMSKEEIFEAEKAADKWLKDHN